MVNNIYFLYKDFEFQMKCVEIIFRVCAKKTKHEFLSKIFHSLKDSDKWVALFSNIKGDAFVSVGMLI
jgi:hypothetical protein